jgi:PII-like signaling protein
MTIEVTVVRIYLTEGQGLLDKLLAKLHDEEKVRGVTVFRGISGFGKSGRMHSSRLLDLSMDLPLVIEFFDEPDKVSGILEHLAGMLAPDHIVSWRARVNKEVQEKETSA